MIIEKSINFYAWLKMRRVLEEVLSQSRQIDHMYRRIWRSFRIYTESRGGAKRRMLLRFIHAVTKHAMAAAETSGVDGLLQRPESSISHRRYTRRRVCCATTHPSSCGGNIRKTHRRHTERTAKNTTSRTAAEPNKSTNEITF